MGREEEEAITELPELPPYYQAWSLSLLSVLLHCTFPNWNSLLLDLTCSTTPHCLHLVIPQLFCFFPLLFLPPSPFHYDSFLSEASQGIHTVLNQKNKKRRNVGKTFFRHFNIQSSAF